MKDVLSIMPYYGGKARMAKFIADMLDCNNTDIYVEPFGGACRVLLNKPRHAVEIYNDYGEGVCAVMRVMSDPETAREFIYRLEETEYSQEEFDRQKAIFDFCEKSAIQTEWDTLKQLLADHGISTRITKKNNKEVQTSIQRLLESDADFAEKFQTAYGNRTLLLDAWNDGEYLQRNRDLYETPISDIELAIATYVIFVQSRDAMGQVWSAYRFKDTPAYHKRLSRLWDCAERMKGVEIMQLDAMQYFRQAADYGSIGEGYEIIGDWLNNPRVMMYCDPSYISPDAEASALKKENLDIDAIDIERETIAKRIAPQNLGALYAMSYNYADHEAFLRTIRHAKCKLTVSNYDLQLYNKYLTPEDGWRRVEFETFTFGKKDNRRTEVLWYNY